MPTRGGSLQPGLWGVVRHLTALPMNYSLFVFLAWQPFWLYFHSPVAGFSLPVFEVS